MAIRQSTSYSASPSPFQQQHEGTPAESEDSNHIEKYVLLDIAFLHNIATYRPIGPHKHFNIIPILINLDRTARQVGASIRDDGHTRAASGEEETSTTLTTATLRLIKKEEEAVAAAAAAAADGDGDRDEDGDEEDDISNDASIAFASLPIEPKTIWLRLSQLYDIDGLEELENLAIDNETSSPFHNGHSIHHKLTSIRTVPIAAATTSFGFGSGLEKKKKSTIITPKSAKSNSKKAATNDENEDEEANENGTVAFSDKQQYEFELGPWDEYENLIAPRRLKSYAPHEDGQSESEEELSEPSDLGAGDEVEGEEEQQQDGDDALSEDVEKDEGEEEVEEDEEGEEDAEEEEEDTSTSKRKVSSKKQGGPSKKAKKPSSPTTTKSRNTRTSAKPRRSARR